MKLQISIYEETTPGLATITTSEMAITDMPNDLIDAASKDLQSRGWNIVMSTIDGIISTPVNVWSAVICMAIGS